MIKTHISDRARQKTTAAQHKAGAKVSVQKSIPIDRVYEDGIFQRGKMFSKTWSFTDINYAVASPEEQTSMMLKYQSAILNGLPPDSAAKITIVNSHRDIARLSRDVLIAEKDDGLNELRGDYNRMIMEKSRLGNSITQTKYITISTDRTRINDARSFFMRAGTDISNSFRALDSVTTEVDTRTRLNILRDFMRPGDLTPYSIDLKDFAKRGHDFRDTICPDRLQFKFDHFELDGKFGRVMFMKGFPNYLRDSMLHDLTSAGIVMSLSIDILPIPTDEAVRETQSKILAIESDITRFQQRQNRANNFSAVVPYDKESAREDTREFLDDLIARDKRMMFGLVTFAFLADTKEELESLTESFKTIGNKNLCQFAPLTFQQEDGLNTALPYGVRPIEAMRTLTTESMAALFPFNAQELLQPGGVYYGTHAVSRNLIVFDRLMQMNPHAFFLGTTGSGKSARAKAELAALALSTNHTIFIIDPQGEYDKLVTALGGEVIRIGAGSGTHINALDLPPDTGDKDFDPVAMKSEFLMSLCEQVQNGTITAKQRSIIDRCTRLLFLDPSKVKTLSDFRNLLLEQPEDDARELAVALELFSDGSMNMFAQPTNVDTSNRIISFNMQNMGKHMRPVAMLVVLDAIQSRVMRNTARGIRTWTYVDEMHLYFRYKYSADYLLTCWKQFRKYGAPMTGITQNIEECLAFEQARQMLANSSCLVLMSQSETDAAALAALLNIPEAQMEHITRAHVPGRDKNERPGLVKYGSAIVPFTDKFPDTSLFELLKTDAAKAPDEI